MGHSISQAPSRGAPRVGIWGTFDLENYGDLLFPRIAEEELLRRLPGATVQPYSPYGYLHPIRLDAGRPAHALGPWSGERVAELAGELDCVLIGGGEIIHTKDELLAQHYGVKEQELLDREPSRFFIEGLTPALERNCPVVWHAVGIPLEPSPEEAERFRAALADRPYVAVRGETSRRRLVDAGVEKDIAVVPDSAFLLPRLFPSDLLRHRVDLLRELGWYPRDRGALVLQGHRQLIPSVDDLAESIHRLLRRRDDLAPVLIGTGPGHGDHELAEALERALPEPSYRLPEGVLVEDLVAAMWGARGLIASSLHANITAFCFDKPHVALNLAEFSKLDDFAQLIESPACVVGDVSVLDEAFDEAERVRNRVDVLRSVHLRIDAHFDRVAEVATEATASPRLHKRATLDGDAELRLADQVRARRLAEERFGATEALVRTRAREHELRERLELLEEQRLAAMEGVAREQDLRERVANLEAQVRLLEERLFALHTSLSFRYTAPLRAVGRGLRGIRGAQQP